MPLPREGSVLLFSASAPSIGPPPGAGETPQRYPLAGKCHGADVYYDRVPPSRVGKRITRNYSFGGGTSRLNMDARGESADNFLKYESGAIAERLKYVAPQIDGAAALKDKSPQRPTGADQALTQKAYISHRVPTPGLYKEMRAPKTRFGPGPGLPINPRFGRSLPKLTDNAYLNQDTPDLNKKKRRAPAAMFASPGSLPSPLGKSSSLRSSIVDARLELRACDELRRLNF